MSELPRELAPVDPLDIIDDNLDVLTRFLDFTGTVHRRTRQRELFIRAIEEALVRPGHPPTPVVLPLRRVRQLVHHATAVLGTAGGESAAAAVAESEIRCAVAAVLPALMGAAVAAVEAGGAADDDDGGDDEHPALALASCCCRMLDDEYRVVRRAAADAAVPLVVAAVTALHLARGGPISAADATTTTAAAPSAAPTSPQAGLLPPWMDAMLRAHEAPPPMDGGDGEDVAPPATPPPPPCPIWLSTLVTRLWRATQQLLANSDHWCRALAPKLVVSLLPFVVAVQDPAPAAAGAAEDPRADSAARRLVADIWRRFSDFAIDDSEIVRNEVARSLAVLCLSTPHFLAASGSGAGDPDDCEWQAAMVTLLSAFALDYDVEVRCHTAMAVVPCIAVAGSQSTAMSLLTVFQSLLADEEDRVAVAACRGIGELLTLLLPAAQADLVGLLPEGESAAGPAPPPFALPIAPWVVRSMTDAEADFVRGLYVHAAAHSPTNGGLDVSAVNARQRRRLYHLVLDPPSRWGLPYAAYNGLLLSLVAMAFGSLGCERLGGRDWVEYTYRTPDLATFAEDNTLVPRLPPVPTLATPPAATPHGRAVSGGGGGALGDRPPPLLTMPAQLHAALTGTSPSAAAVTSPTGMRSPTAPAAAAGSSAAPAPASGDGVQPTEPGAAIEVPAQSALAAMREITTPETIRIARRLTSAGSSGSLHGRMDSDGIDSLASPAGSTGGHRHQASDDASSGDGRGPVPRRHSRRRSHGSDDGGGGSSDEDGDGPAGEARAGGDSDAGSRRSMHTGGDGSDSDGSSSNDGEDEIDEDNATVIGDDCEDDFSVGNVRMRRREACARALPGLAYALANAAIGVHDLARRVEGAWAQETRDRDTEGDGDGGSAPAVPATAAFVAAVRSIRFIVRNVMVVRGITLHLLRSADAITVKATQTLLAGLESTFRSFQATSYHVRCGVSHLQYAAGGLCERETSRLLVPVTAVPRAHQLRGGGGGSDDGDDGNAPAVKMRGSTFSRLGQRSFHPALPALVEVGGGRDGDDETSSPAGPALADDGDAAASHDGERSPAHRRSSGGSAPRRGSLGDGGASDGASVDVSTINAAEESDAAAAGYALETSDGVDLAQGGRGRHRRQGTDALLSALSMPASLSGDDGSGAGGRSGDRPFTLDPSSLASPASRLGGAVDPWQHIVTPQQLLEAAVRPLMPRSLTRFAQHVLITALNNTKEETREVTVATTISALRMWSLLPEDTHTPIIHALVRACTIAERAHSPAVGVGHHLPPPGAHGVPNQAGLTSDPAAAAATSTGAASPPPVVSRSGSGNGSEGFASGPVANAAARDVYMLMRRRSSGHSSGTAVVRPKLQGPSAAFAPGGVAHSSGDGGDDGGGAGNGEHQLLRRVSTSHAGRPTYTCYSNRGWHDHAILARALPQLAAVVAPQVLVDYIVPQMWPLLGDAISAVRDAAADALPYVFGALLIRYNELDPMAASSATAGGSGGGGASGGASSAASAAASGRASPTPLPGGGSSDTAVCAGTVAAGLAAFGAPLASVGGGAATARPMLQTPQPTHGHVASIGGFGGSTASVAAPPGSGPAGSEGDASAAAAASSAVTSKLSAVDRAFVTDSQAVAAANRRSWALRNPLNSQALASLLATTTDGDGGGPAAGGAGATAVAAASDAAARIRAPSSTSTVSAGAGGRASGTASGRAALTGSPGPAATSAASITSSPPPAWSRAPPGVAPPAGVLPALPACGEAAPADTAEEPAPAPVDEAGTLREALRQALQTLVRQVLALARATGLTHHQRLTFIRVCSGLWQAGKLNLDAMTLTASPTNAAEGTAAAAEPSGDGAASSGAGEAPPPTAEAAALPVAPFVPPPSIPLRSLSARNSVDGGSGTSDGGKALPPLPAARAPVTSFTASSSSGSGASPATGKRPPMLGALGRSGSSRAVLQTATGTSPLLARPSAAPATTVVRSSSGGGSLGGADATTGGRASFTEPPAVEAGESEAAVSASVGAASAAAPPAPPAAPRPRPPPMDVIAAGARAPPAPPSRSSVSSIGGSLMHVPRLDVESQEGATDAHHAIYHADELAAPGGVAGGAGDAAVDSRIMAAAGTTFPVSIRGAGAGAGVGLRTATAPAAPVAAPSAMMSAIATAADASAARRTSAAARQFRIGSFVVALKHVPSFQLRWRNRAAAAAVAGGSAVPLSTSGAGSAAASGGGSDPTSAAHSRRHTRRSSIDVFAMLASGAVGLDEGPDTGAEGEMESEAMAAHRRAARRSRASSFISPTALRSLMAPEGAGAPRPSASALTALSGRAAELAAAAAAADAAAANEDDGAASEQSDEVACTFVSDGLARVIAFVSLRPGGLPFKPLTDAPTPTAEAPAPPTDTVVFALFPLTQWNPYVAGLLAVSADVAPHLAGDLDRPPCEYWRLRALRRAVCKGYIERCIGRHLIQQQPRHGGAFGRLTLGDLLTLFPLLPGDDPEAANVEAAGISGSGVVGGSGSGWGALDLASSSALSSIQDSIEEGSPHYTLAECASMGAVLFETHFRVALARQLFHFKPDSHYWRATEGMLGEVATRTARWEWGPRLAAAAAAQRARERATRRASLSALVETDAKNVVTAPFFTPQPVPMLAPAPAVFSSAITSSGRSPAGSNGGVAALAVGTSPAASASALDMEAILAEALRQEGGGASGGDGAGGGDGLGDSTAVDDDGPPPPPKSAKARHRGGGGGAVSALADVAAAGVVGEAEGGAAADRPETSLPVGAGAGATPGATGTSEGASDGGGGDEPLPPSAAARRRRQQQAFV